MGEEMWSVCTAGAIGHEEKRILPSATTGGASGFLLSEDDRGRQLLYDLTYMLTLKAKSFLNEIFTKDQICDEQRQA